MDKPYRHLVLTRYPEQSIIINDNIIVTILHVGGLQVRVGIHAPPNVSIWREELWHKIKAQQNIPEIEKENYDDLPL